MTIEEFVIGYLEETLTVPVSGSVPHPMPEAFVTVEKTGSADNDRVPSATLAIQSWSASRAAAAQLNERVKAAMEAAEALSQISRAGLNSDYNFPDLATNRPRYQAVYDVVYLF